MLNLKRKVGTQQLIQAYWKQSQKLKKKKWKNYRRSETREPLIKTVRSLPISWDSFLKIIFSGQNLNFFHIIGNFFRVFRDERTNYQEWKNENLVNFFFCKGITNKVFKSNLGTVGRIRIVSCMHNCEWWDNSEKLSGLELETFSNSIKFRIYTIILSASSKGVSWREKKN